jgi:DNA-binding NtrC family response regulator
MSTILFVDDHHGFRTVFSEVLRTAGHSVLEAATVTDAEHLLGRQSGPVDVMLVEAVLTAANGLDIVRRIQPTHPEMRLLFVSAESEADLAEKGLLPVGVPFLRKPFDAEQLMEALRKLSIARKATAKPGRSRSAAKRLNPSRTIGGFGNAG